MRPSRLRFAEHLRMRRLLFSMSGARTCDLYGANYFLILSNH
jgi:hypothetical protein